MEKLTREIRQEVSKMLGRIEAIYVKNGFKRMINCNIFDQYRKLCLSDCDGHSQPALYGIHLKPSPLHTCEGSH